jgi:hypothetical protein
VEKVIGPRGQWSGATCRALFDALLFAADRRRVSEAHEMNWLRLAGWTLRPGFGAPDDEARMDAMWALRDEGLAFRSKANWGQWWILWRRIAPGLDADRQRALLAELRPWVERSPSAPPPPGPHHHGPVEMMQLLAALERVPADDKRAIGELLFERVDKLGSYWPLGRVGARTPFHGEASDVVGPDVAAAWLERLLALDWATAEGASFAAASVARVTGDATRDVDPELRRRVADRLARSSAPATWIDMVKRPIDLAAGDLKRILGEALPAGLRLS